MRNRWWAAPVVAAAVRSAGRLRKQRGHLRQRQRVADGSAPAASSGGGGSGSTTASTSAAGIKTAKHEHGTVLVTAQGYTIYCSRLTRRPSRTARRACATFWPPVQGQAEHGRPAPSLPGKFGTIKRAGGSTQATYDGHPLYLFKEDTSSGPGQR